MKHEIILVGGGHTHVQVMRDFALKPLPDAGLTLVTDRMLTPYSGMLPGYIAGKYTRDEMHIDLGRLAKATDTQLILASACGLDRNSRTLLTRCGKNIQYDTLSLNLGITPDLSGIAGADRHGIPVKPISSFIDRLETRLAAINGPGNPHHFAVVGGGAAAVELAFALRARMQRIHGRDGAFRITIAAGNGLVPTLNSCVRRKIRAALLVQGIQIRDDFRAVEVFEEGVKADDGRYLEADTILISTAARAPSWLADTDLPLAKDGSIQTSRSLAVTGDERVFAVGDCGVIEDEPRPKAGVFAVRQGPALVRNLRNRVLGRPLQAYTAQREFLTILMSGDGRATAGKGRWVCVEGRLVWLWKDLIDRRFMRRFSCLG